MTFRLRIMLMVAGALVLAFIGLGYASFALLATQHNTSQFVDRDLKTLQALDDMYAQGLQSGQALRNVILDHGNPQGHSNLDAALAAFDQALDSARRTSPEQDSLWQSLAQQQQQRRTALEQVRKLAGQDSAAAIQLLNSSETPGLAHLAQAAAGRAGRATQAGRAGEKPYPGRRRPRGQSGAGAWRRQPAGGHRADSAFAGQPVTRAGR